MIHSELSVNLSVNLSILDGEMFQYAIPPVARERFFDREGGGRKYKI